MRKIMFCVHQRIDRVRELAELSRQCLRLFVMPVIIITLISNPGVAADGDTSLIVSPISSARSGEVHNGKLVWVDLITTEPKKAAIFYTTVFDWQPQYFSDENYIELSHDGRVMSSVVFYEDEQTVAGDARWLVSISVKDVDVATRIAAENGGEIFESATDLPERGRYSVIGDAQGAVLMLLRATGGDPADESPTLGEWGWAELWTDHPEEAVSFYQAIAGYNALRFPDSKGGERIVLGTDGKARATIVSLPWNDVKPNWIPYIPVANVADTMQRIVGAGGGVLVQSGGSGSAAAVAIVMDPTGGVFAIQQTEFDQ
jgi:predicted enzyme related to lactoylglutathione lyase